MIAVVLTCLPTIASRCLRYIWNETSGFTLVSFAKLRLFQQRGLSRNLLQNGKHDPRKRGTPRLQLLIERVFNYIADIESLAHTELSQKKKKKGTSSKTLASDRPHNGSGDLYSDCTGIMRGFVACVTNQNSYSTSAIWLSYNQAQQTQLHVLFAYAPITQQEPRYCHRVRGSHTILAYDPGDRIEFPKDP